jgi:hypothetical protein
MCFVFLCSILLAYTWQVLDGLHWKGSQLIIGDTVEPMLIVLDFLRAADIFSGYPLFYINSFKKCL